VHIHREGNEGGAAGIVPELGEFGEGDQGVAL
jgi:hypothetical protein